jgi:hypothetical protein
MTTDELLAEAGRQLFALMSRKYSTTDSSIGPENPAYWHLPTCQVGMWIGNYSAPNGAPCSERCQDAHNVLAAMGKQLRIKTIHLRAIRKLPLEKVQDARLRGSEVRHF